MTQWFEGVAKAEEVNRWQRGSVGDLFRFPGSQKFRIPELCPTCPHWLQLSNVKPWRPEKLKEVAGPSKCKKFGFSVFAVHLVPPQHSQSTAARMALAAACSNM
jgi:hypothetical protein